MVADSLGNALVWAEALAVAHSRPVARGRLRSRLVRIAEWRFMGAPRFEIAATGIPAAADARNLRPCRSFRHALEVILRSNAYRLRSG